MMKKIKSYLLQEIKSLIFLLIIFLIFLFVFLIENYDLTFYFVGLNISLFIFFIYSIFEYSEYKVKQNRDEKIHELEEKINNLENEILDQQEDIQTYFITWVHQIKTPITASKLLLENNNLTDNTISDLKEQLVYIDDYTNMTLSYLKVINLQQDLLLKKINLDQVIRPIIKKYSILFIKNNLKLVYNSIDLEVISDGQWLSILFEQIIGNAIKYTTNGQIAIILNDDKSISVIDTGRGILKEDLPKIFDRGYSGLNGSLNRKSSGLGLYLVKKISDRLNISVSVKSQVNQGSEFIIHFLQDNLSNL